MNNKRLFFIINKFEQSETSFLYSYLDLLFDEGLEGGKLS